MNEKVRLGYACVNMTLTNRPNKLGGRVTTSRTARKASWQRGSENPKDWDLSLIGERAVLNATDLLHYLKWNEDNNIKLFRVGSELVPWHDHFELHELPQYDELAAKLLECGNYAREHGHRLTTHPGPFHVLGSPHEHVVEKSIIGLERHSELWDLMGYAPSHENKINIHIGGAYGDHELTATRWIKNYYRLSEACRARLVVENDDKPSMYSVRQLYDLFHSETGIPITFDYHHHMFHPAGLSEYEALQMAASTWPDDVRQCTHYSECRRHEFQQLFETKMAKQNIPLSEVDQWPTFAKMKHDIDKIRMQAHSNYIKDEIRTYDMELDIVVEAKAKELAVLEYRNIYQYNKKVLL
jgi:UV DNA damage endonuclease